MHTIVRDTFQTELAPRLSQPALPRSTMALCLYTIILTAFSPSWYGRPQRFRRFWNYKPASSPLRPLDYGSLPTVQLLVRSTDIFAGMMFSLMHFDEPKPLISGVPGGSLRTFLHYGDTPSLLFTYGASLDSMSYYGALLAVAATAGATPALLLNCTYRSSLVESFHISTVDVAVPKARRLPGGTPRPRKEKTKNDTVSWPILQLEKFDWTIFQRAHMCEGLNWHCWNTIDWRSGIFLSRLLWVIRSSSYSNATKRNWQTNHSCATSVYVRQNWDIFEAEKEGM